MMRFRNHPCVKMERRVIQDHVDKRATRILSFVPVDIRGVRTKLIRIPL